MRARNHPPIAQPQIKDSRPRSPAGHRVPGTGPNLHFMPTLFWPSTVLSKHLPCCRDHKREKQERENPEIAASSNYLLHRPTRLPDSRSFCNPVRAQIVWTNTLSPLASTSIPVRLPRILVRTNPCAGV